MYIKLTIGYRVENCIQAIVSLIQLELYREHTPHAVLTTITYDTRLVYAHVQRAHVSTQLT